MVELVYNTLLTVCWSVLLFMGCYLIFGKVVESLRSSVYSRSRCLVGIGFVILGVEYLLFSLFNLRIVAPHHTIALSLSVLSVVGVLFAKAIFPLLGDGRYLGRRWIVGEVVYQILFLGSIWSVMIFGDELRRYIVLVFGLIAFLCRVCIWGTSFFKGYNRIRKVADNNYSESIDSTISWMPNSIVFIIGLSYVSGLAAFAPLWCIIIYILYAFFIFGYVFAKLIGMMLDDHVVRYLCDVSTSDEVELEDSEGDAASSGENIAELRPYLVGYIDRRLTEWVESEGYLCSDITIKSLSAMLNTNRTYLSNYINTRYKCTFRDWIASMRLDRAKQLFKSSPGLSIADIAKLVGFTSPTSFSRAFLRVEGVSPNQWREVYVFDRHIEKS